MTSPLLWMLFAGSALAADAGGARPVLKQVSAIVIETAWSGNSIRIEDAGQIRDVVGELNTLRRRDWQPWFGKLGACSRRMVFQHQDDRLLHLYMDANGVIELPLVKGERRFALKLSASEAPRLRELARQLPLREPCRD